MKKVLMIAYFFPPVAGGGVQRTVKFSKYLPGFGWKPVVLTVKAGFDYYSDPGLLHDIQTHVTVYRSRSIEPMKFVRKWMKRKSDTKKQVEKTLPARDHKRPWLLKLKEILFIPDTEIGWLPFAVLKGLHIVKKEKIDCLFSTSTPYTDHLVALLLKKITKLPWIADFRDPWSLNLHKKYFRWRTALDRCMERWVFKNARCTISVTEPMTADFRRLYPPGRYVTIPNGYDEEDFAGLPVPKKTKQFFTITYTGILYKERTPKVFLTALAGIIQENSKLAGKWRIQFVGQMDNPGETENADFLASLKLGEVVRTIPYVSHNESLKYAIQSDVLVLIINEGFGSKAIMTGKLFEYLRCRKPILALVPPEGAAAEVIRETKSGIIVPPGDVHQCKDVLIHLYHQYQKGILGESFSPDTITRYSRAELTRRLARECDSLVP
jgi:glycosyltransferase involved in cell wall biosynthesis